MDLNATIYNTNIESQSKPLCGDNIGDNICNILNDNRTYDNILDKLSTETNIDSNSSTFELNIYRYKFTQEFTVELFKFSKIHQYDHRKDFKEAWEKWVEENEDLVNEEYRRLSNLGYNGDIMDKMFKSARYYYRKKNVEEKKPVERRIYIGSQKDMLDAMDEHITSNLSREFKPSDGFDDFCKKNVDIIKTQVTLLCQAGYTDANEIKSKVKKTYKNRYFLIVSK